MLVSLQVVYNDLCRIVIGISEKSFGTYVMAEFQLGILKIKIYRSNHSINFQQCKIFLATLIGFESRQMFVLRPFLYIEKSAMIYNSKMIDN